jgi:hypothetical protein
MTRRQAGSGEGVGLLEAAPWCATFLQLRVGGVAAGTADGEGELGLLMSSSAVGLVRRGAGARRQCECDTALRLPHAAQSRGRGRGRGRGLTEERRCVGDDEIKGPILFSRPGSEPGTCGRRRWSRPPSGPAPLPNRHRWSASLCHLHPIPPNIARPASLDRGRGSLRRLSPADCCCYCCCRCSTPAAELDTVAMAVAANALP